MFISCPSVKTKLTADQICKKKHDCPRKCEAKCHLLLNELQKLKRKCHKDKVLGQIIRLTNKC